MDIESVLSVFEYKKLENHPDTGQMKKTMWGDVGDLILENLFLIPFDVLQEDFILKLRPLEYRERSGKT